MDGYPHHETRKEDSAILKNLKKNEEKDGRPDIQAFWKVDSNFCVGNNDHLSDPDLQRIWNESGISDDCRWSYGLHDVGHEIPYRES
jgi:hypothetical protein